MKTIQMWAVAVGDKDKPAAQMVDEVSTAETEKLLEDVLVESPDLLVDGVMLIGRQVPTQGGPLDLVGVDSDGRGVVFELKRGLLTRDAVAQVFDYVSDLATMEPDDFARLIERSSGSNGIPEIEDFSDWFGREYPDASEFDPTRIRMVLVGLGADERAKRVVNYLADKGIDIQLLTFHAFRRGGDLFIARQVETKEPARTTAATGPTKEDNQRHLMQLADEMGCRDVLEEVAKFVDDRLPAYKWPGKTAYSFSLQERTIDGRPTLRAYVTLYVSQKLKGHVSLTLTPRAIDAAGDVLNQFKSAVTTSPPIDQTIPLQVDLNQERWSEVAPHLDELLHAIEEGWEQKRAREDSAAAQAALESESEAS